MQVTMLVTYSSLAEALLCPRRVKGTRRQCVFWLQDSMLHVIIHDYVLASYIIHHQETQCSIVINSIQACLLHPLQECHPDLLHACWPQSLNTCDSQS